MRIASERAENFIIIIIILIWCAAICVVICAAICVVTLPRALYLSALRCVVGCVVGCVAICVAILRCAQRAAGGSLIEARYRQSAVQSWRQSGGGQSNRGDSRAAIGRDRQLAV